MIDEEDKDISVRRQCELLNISRSQIYYKSRKQKDRNKENIISLIRKINEDCPFYGARKIRLILKANIGVNLSRYCIGKMMKENRIKVIVKKRSLTKQNKEHRKYPYLLRKLEITRKNQVWSTDITYIRVNGGYVYLMAIIDLYSRKILSWGISNTQDTGFCLEVLCRALNKYGKPEIFNTDQGSQYTSKAFTAVLEANGIKISMDGVGRALDNIYIERFWRTIKYEEIYLKEYRNLKELKIGVRRYMDFYNKTRFHQSLNYKTPNQIYNNSEKNGNKVIIPHYSWIISYYRMKEYDFERCVDIFKKGRSLDDELRIA